MSELCSPRYLAQLESITKDSKLTAAEKLYRCTALGYLMIGTVVEQSMHTPQHGQTFFSLEAGVWVLIENVPDARGILRATSRVPHAIACGVWGDYNYNNPGQRTRENMPLIKNGMFGWEPEELDDKEPFNSNL